MELIQVENRIINLSMMIDALFLPDGSLTLTMAATKAGSGTGSVAICTIKLAGGDANRVWQHLASRAV